jgi:cobalt-zinc-cadmium efflux system outer membrane protein
VRREIRKRLCAVALASSSIAMACATIEPKRGFTDVQSAVAGRIDRDVEWDQGTQQDAHVRQSVERLLTDEIGVEAALQIALLNNPMLQATYEDLGVAQADLVQAGLLRNPVFSGFARVPRGSPSQTNFEFDVAQEFVSLLFLPARRRVAGANFEARKLHVIDAVLDLAARVKGAYFGLQAAENIAHLVRASTDVAAASAELAAKMHEAGNLGDLELARERAIATELGLDVERRRGEVDIARETLTRLMGLTGDEGSWSVPPRLPAIPREQPPLDDLERAALTRPDIAALRQEADTLREALGLTRLSRWFPFVELGIDNERDTSGQWVHGPNVSIQLPIFDRGEAGVARAEAELRRSERRLVALGVAARSEIREARSRMERARRLAETAGGSLIPLRQEVVARALERYNYMFVGASDVLAAKRDELEADRIYVMSVRDYWIARCDLERAVGRTLGPPHEAPAESPRSATEPPTRPSHGGTHP